MEKSLFDCTENMKYISEIYYQISKNCPKPRSNSKELWKLRRETNIGDNNPFQETMLEKAVAMLAKNEHMKNWYNQCPTASGITSSSRNKKSNVDLVHWCQIDKHARLIELKCDSRDQPVEAMRQVLRYGATYLFCRKHKDSLPISGRPIMCASHVSLLVAAPSRFYKSRDSNLSNCLSKARIDLNELLIDLDIPGLLSMSLDVMRFPDCFEKLPFSKGSEVKAICSPKKLTPEGKAILEAFNNLSSVCPDPDGNKD